MHIQLETLTIIKHFEINNQTMSTPMNLSFNSPSYFSETSSFLREVTLVDWWLSRSESVQDGGNDLCIGGLASREGQAARFFSSAPIMKRFDTFNLETADGFNVMIQGLINFRRTTDSGISSEICNHFLVGFPYYWETYAKQSMAEMSTCKTVPTKISDLEKSALPHFDNSGSRDLLANLDVCHVTTVRDLLLIRRESAGKVRISLFTSPELYVHEASAVQDQNETMSEDVAEINGTQLPSKRHNLRRCSESLSKSMVATLSIELPIPFSSHIRKDHQVSSPVLSDFKNKKKSFAENPENGTKNAQKAFTVRGYQNEKMIRKVDKLKKSEAQLPLKRHRLRRYSKSSKKLKLSVDDDKKLDGDGSSNIANHVFEGTVELIQISSSSNRDISALSPTLSVSKKNETSYMQVNQKEIPRKDEVQNNGAHFPLKRHNTRKYMERSMKSKTSVKDMTTISLEKTVHKVPISLCIEGDLPFSSPCLPGLTMDKSSRESSGNITNNAPNVFAMQVHQTEMLSKYEVQKSDTQLASKISNLRKSLTMSKKVLQGDGSLNTATLPLERAVELITISSGSDDPVSSPDILAFEKNNSAVQVNQKDEVQSSREHLFMERHNLRLVSKRRKNSEMALKDKKELHIGSTSNIANLSLHGAIEQVAISSPIKRDLQVSSPTLSAVKKNEKSKSHAKVDINTLNASCRRSSVRLKKKLMRSEDIQG